MDKHDRRFSCSINNINKVKSTDLASKETADISLSSYEPEDNFWTPIVHETEEEEDWSDF